MEDTFFQPGEWAPANQPILSLLTDDRVRLRFFVPEDRIADYRPGDRWVAPLLRDLELAQADGRVRADATGYDFAAIPLALAGMAHLAEPMRHIVGMRIVTIMLDGLRAPGATPLASISLTLEDYHRGVHGLDDARAEPARTPGTAAAADS